VNNAGGVARHIDLTVGALATSGDSRRFLLKDGKRYGHVLDPRSGWPVVGAPRSVTVAAATCTEAGMLATLALLQGTEAEAFLEAQAVQFWALR
jgi:thiamine biosynthesis lipoprotein